MLLNYFGVDEFLPNSQFMTSFANAFCKDEDITQFLCSNVLFAIGGYNPSQMNTTLLPVIFGHVPAGASTRQVLHYAQEIRSGMK